MIVKLSKRLSAIANMVPAGTVVADIGTDHGYLPVHLVMNGICPQAIAADISPGPLNSAKQLVELLNLTRKIHIRRSDGLQAISPGEAQTVCIAGMGGQTIVKILTKAPHILDSVQRLILQPMRWVSEVRIWITQNGWTIINEDIVFEDDKFYEIIAAEKGQSELTKEEVEFGPMLLSEKHPLLNQYIAAQITTLKDLEHDLEGKDTTKVLEKRMELRSRISYLEKVSSWL